MRKIDSLGGLACLLLTLISCTVSIFTKDYYKNTNFDLSEIQKCIPEGVKEKKTDFLWNNRFYCITFRK